MDKATEKLIEFANRVRESNLHLAHVLGAVILTAQNYAKAEEGNLYSALAQAMACDMSERLPEDSDETYKTRQLMRHLIKLMPLIDGGDFIEELEELSRLSERSSDVFVTLAEIGEPEPLDNLEEGDFFIIPDAAGTFADGVVFEKLGEEADFGDAVYSFIYGGPVNTLDRKLKLCRRGSRCWVGKYIKKVRL